MSWRASGYVKGLTVAPNGEALTRSEKLLLLVLADHYDEEQQAAWPSANTLAREALMTREHVWRVVKELARKGLVAVEQRRGERGQNISNRYRLPSLVIGDSQPPSDSGTTILVTPESLPSDTEITSLVTPGLPKPKEEPKREPTTRAAKKHADPRVAEVYEYFRARIHPRSRTCPYGKIAARLKTFSLEELKEGIDRFAANEWRMKNNATMGADWFFGSDAQSEKWLHVQPTGVNGGPDGTTARQAQGALWGQPPGLVGLDGQASLIDQQQYEPERNERIRRRNAERAQDGALREVS